MKKYINRETITSLIQVVLFLIITILFIVSPTKNMLSTALSGMNLGFSMATLLVELLNIKDKTRNKNKV